MLKQKPCVTERAPCDFGTGLPVLRFPGSAWLANASANIKGNQEHNRSEDAEALFMSDESVMKSDKNPFSPHMQIEVTFIV